MLGAVVRQQQPGLSALGRCEVVLYTERHRGSLATLTALAFWNAWSKVQRGKDIGFIPPPSHRTATTQWVQVSFILPGILLGLTLYTYQPSRVVPLIYLVFVAYLFWRARDLIKANWKGLALFFGVAVMIAAPLFIYLTSHPGAETARAFQTEPIRALFNGDFAPIREGLELLRELHRRRNYRPIADTIHGLLEATRAHAGFAFRKGGERVLEVYLLDFQGNLRDQPMLLEWLEFHRGQQRFHSPEDLVEQMRLDEAHARQWLDRHAGGA